MKSMRGLTGGVGPVGMNAFRLLIMAGATAATVASAGAADGIQIAGVTIPREMVQDGSGQRLLLRGAGVRKKLFVKVYVGALYLSEKDYASHDITSSRGAKTVTMTFLYRKVAREKLVETWKEGFAANLDPAEVKRLGERLVQFAALFQTVQRGNQYRLNFLPGRGAEVRLNGKRVGIVPGDDLSRAVLKVWFGPQPADTALAKGMLGL